MVQTVALFLCEHIGERLEDYFYSTRNGKRVTIKIHCYRLVDRAVCTRYRRSKTNRSFETLSLVQTYDVNLISVEEGIDSSQASGKLLISVLSAVSEIERENILEQTMNGRREKARQGLWNGGPAPYGYNLKGNTLEIDEEEAKVIRLIFDKFANSDMGYGGVAKYLNLQGIIKNQHKGSDITVWSGRCIQSILDNPVYIGKIAYGRRVRKKVKGSKNAYKTVRTDDCLLCDGQHEAIIDDETWEKVRTKRQSTGVKAPSKVGRERVHLLSGLLRCPKCGCPMYCNRHYWTNKDGTYKDIYYYFCAHSTKTRGGLCDYNAKLRKTDIEPYVIEALKELVRGENFAEEIKSRIGREINTELIDRELANYKKKLLEVNTNKTNLEESIDNMPLDVNFRERKLNDMQMRLDTLYDTITELEEKIEDAVLRKKAMEEEAMTLDNIYKLLLSFDEIYDRMTDEEQKLMFTYLVKNIQVYANDEDAQMPLKSITLNFPIFKDNREVNHILWDKNGSVETLVVLSRIK